MTNLALLLVALAAPAIGDTALHAVEGENVEITNSEGDTAVGELETFGDDVVVLVLSDGQLVEIPRASIQSVKLAAAAPAPTSPAPPPATAAPVNMCMGDESCEDPRVCIEGECRVPAGYTDELRSEAAPRIKHGRWMLIAGAATLGVGVIILGTGFGISNACTPDLSFAEFERCNSRSARAYDAAFAGVGIAAAGALLLIIGGGTYGMGKNKLKRADRHDKQIGFSVLPGRREVGFALRGRF